MNTQFERTLTRLARIAPALLLAAACLIIGTTVSAVAQTGSLTVTNNTKCDITVCLANGGPCITFAAGTTTQINVPCTGLYQMIICGAKKVIGPGHTYLAGVDVGGGCCADVALSPGFVACTWFLTLTQVNLCTC